ncbi:hypothetical protein KM043_000639 [Ampulex compressa]|nr:hypothetical protein KM043_000639 [Ampulex compressa]
MLGLAIDKTDDVTSGYSTGAIGTSRRTIRELSAFFLVPRRPPPWVLGARFDGLEADGMALGGDRAEERRLGDRGASIGPRGLLERLRSRSLVGLRRW